MAYYSTVSASKPLPSIVRNSRLSTVSNSSFSSSTLRSQSRHFHLSRLLDRIICIMFYYLRLSFLQSLNRFVLSHFSHVFYYPIRYSLLLTHQPNHISNIWLFTIIFFYVLTSTSLQFSLQYKRGRKAGFPQQTSGYNHIMKMIFQYQAIQFTKQHLIPAFLLLLLHCIFQNFYSQDNYLHTAPYFFNDPNFRTTISALFGSCGQQALIFASHGCKNTNHFLCLSVFERLV